MPDKERIKNHLLQKGFSIKNEEKIDYGYKITLTNRAIVSCYDTGKFNVQGKNPNPVEEALKELENVDTPSINKNVFVVYGHDREARTQLEAMLRRWQLNPIILDQLPPDGKTIIEQIEDTTSKAGYGIVLVTPDDIGYSKKDPIKKHHRVRQNVVLELGILLAKLGRDKTTILLSEKEADMEKPSDIDGLIYLSFTNSVEETQTSLAKQLVKHGYNIDVKTL